MIWFLDFGWRCTMKTLFGFILSALLSTVAIAQDNTKHDPLLGHYILANSAEVVHLTESRMGRLIARHDVHDFLSNGQMGGPGSGGAADSLGLSVERRMDYVAADVNGDGKDELIVARAGESNVLTLSVSSARLVSGLDWTWETTSVLELGGDTVAGPIRLIALNLDWTPREELIVCFRDPKGLKVILYDSIDAITHTPVQVGSTWFPQVSFPIQEFDVAAGDFDRDGLDEIVIVTHEMNQWNQHSLILYPIDYDPAQKRVQWWGGAAWDADGVPWSLRTRLKITAGDFRNRGFDEVVISATEKNGNTGRQVFNYVTVDPVSHRFGMEFPLLTAVPVGSSWGNGWESNAVAADLNPLKKDGDELVGAGPGELAVLKFDSLLKPYYLVKTPFSQPGFLEPYERRKFLDVADINADTAAVSWAPEIVLAEHLASDSSTNFRVFAVTRSASDSISGLNQLYSGSAGSPRSAISELVMGDFNGDAIRIGPPKLITKNAFSQPIVSLNVPPTHFDILNGKAYDVCMAYGTNVSQFRATYSQTQSQTSQFSSEMSQSWGVSAEAGGGFSAFGMKVKGSVGASYGKGFYGSQSLDTTTTVSEAMTSWLDDWTLATVADYDLWEYPMYLGGAYRGGVLVQMPHFTMTQWLPSKDVLALDWMDDHEVGNLLTYLPPAAVAGWAGSDLLTSFSAKRVAAGSQMQWSLDLSTQNISEDQLTREVGANVSASVKGWGMEASVSGDYAKEDIITHTSTATKYVTIAVNVSEPDRTIPADASYSVIPFIYWGKNGALTVEYAVDLPPGPPGYETFWGLNYSSHPDPAFILPWRLDVEKGVGSNPNMKLYSKSLRVSPSAPSAGDRVHITARVHNFSLKDTDGPATVRFYLGNPEAGGIPIVGTGGLTDLSTIGPISARDRATVEMDWIVPPGLDQTARVYAVIDPNNSIAEIHEDNNIGFVPLRVVGPAGVEDELQESGPEHYVLLQNYPNPFNPATVIPYEVPERSHVTLTVYDILGRTVASLVNEFKEAGRHHVVFDGKGLATGMYLYRLQAGPFSITKKMMAIK
jgi:hypothetical protein